MASIRSEDMHYYKAKDGKSLLALKNELTVENYPEYTAEMIAEYVGVTKEEYHSLSGYNPHDETL